MQPTVLFVAAFDSQLKWCAPIRDELVRRGFAWQVVAPDTRTALSPGQVAAAGFTDVVRLSRTELVARAVEADVVVSALSGPSTQALIVSIDAELGAKGTPGPVIVAGWVGVIIEKITAGYLDRCGADIIAVNSRQDETHFREVAARLGLTDGNLLLSGLPLLSSMPQPQTSGAIRRVLFADQPTVPGPVDERLYLYQRLIRYARLHPGREVVLKPRRRPEEDTFHRMRHHPEDLLKGVDAPANFRIGYESITDVLPRTDLLLTVSSTACLEAIDAGCRVSLILDLGVHERLGNHVLLDSGLLRTFDRIEIDDLGSPDPCWRDGYFFPRAGTAAAVVADRIVTLVAGGRRPGAVARDSDYFRSIAAFHRDVVSQRTPRRVSPLRRQLARVARPLRRAMATVTAVH